MGEANGWVAKLKEQFSFWPKLRVSQKVSLVVLVLFILLLPAIIVVSFSPIKLFSRADFTNSQPITVPPVTLPTIVPLTITPKPSTTSAQLSCKPLIFNAMSNVVPPFDFSKRIPLSGGATLVPGRYYLYGLKVNNLSGQQLTSLKVNITQQLGSKEPLIINNAENNCVINKTTKSLVCQPPINLAAKSSAFVKSGYTVQIKAPTVVTNTGATTMTLYNITSNLGNAKCAIRMKVMQTTPTSSIVPL